MAMLNLVLLGGPGSGKGTQAEFLQREYALQHISSGELYREHMRLGTPLGVLARGFIDRGELAPDLVTNEMVEARLAELVPAQGCLLDGFPRTLDQAGALAGILCRVRRALTGAIYLRVADDELLPRLTGRRVCTKCEASYHLLFRPPARENICDRCGAPLYQRDDDTHETAQARLATYHRRTHPVIEYYRQAGLLAEVNGSGELREITCRVHEQVEQMLKAKC